MDEPVIDVCIPVHNAVEYVGRCIQNIEAHTQVPFRFIIHDDASDTETRMMLEEFARVYAGRIILARSDHQCWFTISVNRCLSLTRSEWILVINSDVALHDPEWFQKFSMLHERTDRCGLIGCPDSVWDRGPGYEVDGKVQGHIWFFKRANLQHVGLLDDTNPDNLHIRSDDEWSHRWRRKGFRTMFASSVRHTHGGESHPGGGASWGRQMGGVPSKNEHIALARNTPMRIIVDK